MHNSSEDMEFEKASSYENISIVNIYGITT